MPGLVKVAGAWKNIATPSVKVGGTFKEVNTGYVKVGGAWKVWYTGVPPIAPGDYTLTATSLSLGSSSGHAEFATTPYRGRITAIWCQVGWSTVSTTSFTMSCTGRTSGNYYRPIDNDADEWNGRTINHRIDSWDAGSLTEFNAGTAIGFTFANSGIPSISSKVNTVKLKITIT